MKTRAIIARLASTNSAPRLQSVTEPRRGRPVFPDSYDWKEQVRVLKAIGELLHERSADGWEELLAHFGDSRYCVTLALDGELDWGRNFSVGSICRSTASDQFEAVLRRRELYLGERPVAAFEARDLKTWREERKGQSLYQLQIELCKLAREKVRSPRVRAIWPRRAPELDLALGLQIEELARTKKPVLETWSLFLFYTPFTYMPTEFWRDDDGDAIQIPPRSERTVPLMPGTRRKPTNEPKLQASEEIDSSRSK